MSWEGWCVPLRQAIFIPAGLRNRRVAKSGPAVLITTLAPLMTLELPGVMITVVTPA